MGAGTAPERCEEHGLAVGPDRLCVLCRRSGAPEPGRPARTPVPSFAQRVLSWPPALKLPGIAEAVGAFKRSLPPRAPSPSPPPRAPSPTPSEPAASSPSPARPARVSSPGRSAASSLRAAMGLSQNPTEGFDVVFYALSTCSVCRAARDYMQHHGIVFRERDVERDSSAAADALRLNPRRSVPTFQLGAQVLVGFTPHEFEDALSRARASARSGRP